MKVQNLTEGILASIPWHFMPDETGAVRGCGGVGLLLLHSIWVCAREVSIRDDLKGLARKALLALGRNTGIGQAVLMSDVSEITNSMHSERAG